MWRNAASADTHTSRCACVFTLIHRHVLCECLWGTNLKSHNSCDGNKMLGSLPLHPPGGDEPTEGIKKAEENFFSSSLRRRFPLSSRKRETSRRRCGCINKVRAPAFCVSIYGLQHHQRSRREDERLILDSYPPSVRRRVAAGPVCVVVNV